MADNTEATPAPAPAKPMMCGGLTDKRGIEDNDKALFEEYRDIIEQKVREQFQIPNDFKLEPAKVRTQIVAGTNYYFHVRLPNDEFAHVKVFKPLQCHALASGDRSSFVTVEKETTKE